MTASAAATAGLARNRALDEVRARARAELVGELVYDVLSRRAEVRGAAPSLEEVTGRATELGLSPDRAGSDVAELIEVLVNGPRTASGEEDLARLEAFFARGLAAKLERLPEADRPELCRRLAQLHDRLCITGCGGFVAFVDDLLPERDADCFWEALGQTIAEEARAGELRRAALVLRIDGLRHAPARRRELLLAALNGEAPGSAPAGAGPANGSLLRDPTLTYGTGRHDIGSLQRSARPALAVEEALAASRLAQSSTVRPTGPLPARTGESVSVEGRDVAPRLPRFWRTLGLLTGITVIARLVGLFARFVLGYRRQATLTLSDQELRYVVDTEMLGRHSSQRERRIRLGAVTVAGREVAEGATGLYVGVGAIAVGALVGALIFGDGLAGRSGSLVLLGFTLIATGIGVEIGAYYLGALRGGPPRCGLEIEALPRLRIRLADVETQPALRLLETLTQRVARRPVEKPRA
jgi:hypothetical protein